MRDEEKRPTALLHSADDLRKLIIEHPDLPLLVLASEDANSGDYPYMSCNSVSAEVGEFLDCMQYIDDEHIFTDRYEFEDKICDTMYDYDGSDQEFEQEVERRVMEYDPYWKPCIIVYVGN